MTPRISATASPAATGAAVRPSWLPKRFKTLIIYCDLAAARRAMDRLVRTIRHSHREAVLHPMLWRLDQLNDARWREPSLRDAMDAGLIVFAMKTSVAFSAEASGWLEAVVARKGGATICVMTLAGDEEAWSICIGQASSASKRQNGEDKAAAPVFMTAVEEEYFARSA